MTQARTQRLLIDTRSAGTRLDVFLVEHFTPEHGSTRRLSRSEIQRLIGEGQVTLNGAKTKASARVRFNDRIDVRLLPPRETTLGSEALPLEVIHEDADCIVINKAPGLTVHPAAGHWSGTLVNALLHHCRDIQGIGGERRPGIVHRLDKDTSGVMIVAKNTAAYSDLVLQFKHRTVEKEYVALAWGRVVPDKGIIDRPIGRHRSDRKKMSSIRFSQKTRTAVTEWAVEQRFAPKSAARSEEVVSLLRLFPRTGRTHQLRVHLADSGHPLLGDQIYGKQHRISAKKPWADPILMSFPRQALHAAKLVLNHPRTGKRVAFAAPLPQDFRDLLHHLRTIDSRQGLTR
jgi:23S rRNA pseudouridine1911/1915/1917 synthase